MMDIIKMKKVVSLFFIIFLAQNYYSQQSLGEGTAFSIASPSMASMSRYTDTPVNLVSGLPNINIPIVGVPIQDQNISTGFNLSYSPKFVDSKYYAASDVGAGWTLFGGSVIYKKVVGDLDEVYDDSNKSGYKKNLFDDYYYYNLPGLSGKFQIKRDTINNTFSLINLSPNNVKFDYSRENNNATLKIDNFTVTDGKGYKFVFNDFDFERREWDPFILNNGGYKSAYFLTQIISPTGKILATYTYDKKSKTLSSGKLLYQYCKLKMIETDLGKVILDYQFDESLASTPNDLYSLQKITVKNSLDQIINIYTLNYTTSSYPYDQNERKRLLTSIIKNDKNNVKIEQTSFVYNQEGNNFPPVGGQSYCNWGGSVEDSYYTNYKFPNILVKIISPLGGVTQYDYGIHEIFFNYNQEYLDSILYGYVDSKVQYTAFQPDKHFDTAQANKYTFTISGNSSKKIGFMAQFIVEGYNGVIPPYLAGDPEPEPFYTNYVIKNSAGEIMNGISCNFGVDNTGTRVYNGYPGVYTVEITGTGKGYGLIRVNEVKLNPPPYRNAQKTLHYGPRLNNIKNYNGINDTTPSKIVSYNYDTEDNTGSSGYVFTVDGDDQYTAPEGYVMYKNVKVSQPGNGYTRYTFINPNDYPKYQNGGSQSSPTYFYPNYNITKGGLVKKREVYNEQNQLLTSENTVYEIDNYSDQSYQFYIRSSQYTSKPAYIKKVTASSKDYSKNGGVIENKKESLFSVSNLKPVSTKEIAANGDMIEKSFFYPKDVSGYSHLENAYMVSEPVKTITKNNGKIISNTQVKFDNNSLLPTSIISTNPNDNSVKTAIKYDAYDQKDNVRQYTAVTDENTGQGVSTTIIWGYNDMFPIAKIQGATINDIGTLMTDSVSKSNLDKDEASEKTLLQALDTFRTHASLKNFQITTYTYDPLIGITTVTPPNGMREIYKYDQNYRLKAVIDVNGNIIKDYKYNTKPQP